MTNQERPFHDSAVRTFYSQLLQLLEFTRDMDRNFWDSKFAMEGNHIHYVFDENVFEFFVGARNQIGEDDSIIFADRRKYSAAFHLAQWRDDLANNLQEERWTRINRQTAIVAGEYVLGGALPGQYDGRLCLTEWHAKELLHRFTVLKTHFRTKSKAEIRESERIQRNIETIIKVSSDPAVNVDELLKKASIPRPDLDAIHDDVHRLRDAGVDNKILLNFAAARILAANLIDDDVIEPVQQIRRIYSKEIAGRFFPLQMLSPRPAWQDIREDALAWQKLIRIEEEEKKVQATRRRNSQRLAADASSLAYVQWLAKRLDSEPPDGKPRRRVVLVTGDTLLFDAYRRWWVQNTDRVFALRRVGQYAPILNFRDAKSTIAFNKDIFENIRRAIEPQLVYFNLAEPAMDKEQSRIDSDAQSRGESGAIERSRSIRRHGGREHLALLLKEKDPLESHAFKLFAQEVGRKLVDKGRSDLGFVKKEWQGIERLAIGLYHELITRRLDEEHRHQLRQVLAKGEGIDKFINDQLDEIYNFGAVLYVPQAFDSLRRWVKFPPGNVTTRAPIALRLAVSPSPVNGTSGSTPVDVAAMATALVEGIDVEDTFRRLEELWLRNPERLFALASTIALRLSLWEQAVMYAGLAAGSHSAEAIRDNPKRDDKADYFELLYLRALALRFRIGSISNAEAYGELRARLDLDSAVSDLTACIAYHATPDDGGERHLLRELRARSERAAVQGFYASWRLVHAKRSGPLSDDDVRAVVQSLKLAQEDLTAGTEMFAAAEARARWNDVETKTGRLGAFFSVVARQVTINTAALYVFREYLKRQGAIGQDELLLDHAMLARTRDVLKTQLANQELADEVSEILNDVHLFFWLFEGDVEFGKRLRSYYSVSTEGMLKVDKDLNDLHKEAFAAELPRQD